MRNSLWLMKESFLHCREIISRDFQKRGWNETNWQICHLWIVCTVAVNSTRRVNTTCLFIWHEKAAGACAGGWRQALTESRSRFAAERSAGDRVARLYPDIKEKKQLGEVRRASFGSEWFSAPGRLQNATHALALFNGGALKHTPAFGCNQLVV